MKANYKFSNICGTVYQQGNILFTPDGNTLLSPVGNRVSVFDLVNNKSRTLPVENRKNIAAIALSPDGNVLVSIDEDGRALLVNFKRGVVLHHFNFQKPVKDIQFSHDGKFIAVTHESHVQVWRTPNHLVREFAPFVLHRTYTGHHDEVSSIRWSPDSTCFITTSRDMTARLFTLDPLEGFRPKTFAGHKDAVVGAYFSANGKFIYTVSRDGAVFTWTAKDEPDDAEALQPVSSTFARSIPQTRWGVHDRHYFNLPNTKVVCTTFHPSSNLLVVGFSSGVFGLWELPAFTNIHTLSISQEKISSVAISPSGEWLAFGARRLGQLLGHYFDMNTLVYAPDGQTIATGGDDGKLKVWSVQNGFCFVTFSEHTAPIMDITFAKHGSILFSASLDGTVRAFDLVRYRNFRTFTSPSPVQFSSIAVDPSGEVVAAGSTDTFEVFMWSVQTGKLLDILAGHEAPVSALAFSPTGANQLASGSWDRTIRIWNVFGRSRAVEPLTLSSDVLSIAFRPDGVELGASTLDGQITLFDVRSGKQSNVIDGRKDVSGGRKADDRMGRVYLPGGNSKYVCLYDVRGGEGVLVKKFQISENLSLDGTQEFLDSRKVNDAGINIDLIDDRGDASDLEDRMDTALPGASRGAGDMSVRKHRQEARTKCVRFSPTGRAWAAASTEGLLIYSLDDTVMFDPFDLTLDLTPQAVLNILAEGEYLKALVLAFRLNEKPIIQQVYERIPHSDIRLVARQMPDVYVPALLRFTSEHLEKSPHLEFDLIWVQTVITAHWSLPEGSVAVNTHQYCEQPRRH
ncbi:WD40-repeat-containing domain protein [Suillus paluster]|uniref:WD40-repeat-containing domain protein n=1 Tax=Suillus paluster TaxID=48578 RepID=UPI001B864515|nr:WD40-repeat-containing domain protein [Suillus paluster]KAG1736147.1 WD40-repeat-containing domain protein [Suillus paluster]